VDSIYPGNNGDLLSGNLHSTQYTVQRDMDKDLKFTGRMIASVASTSDKTKGHWYSGYVAEWTGLSLHQTQAGAFVCGRVTHIVLDGERDAYEAAVCNSQDAVIEFFGTDWLAKKLYEQAEIEVVEGIA
jgi:hypothetical protein